MKSTEGDGIPPKTVGPWQTEARLGSGGMGEVYLGRRNGELAAIKILQGSLSGDERERARFRREYEAARAVSSPRVATLIDADFDGSPAYIASRYYDAPTLREAVQADGPLDDRELVQFARGLAEGIAAIHEAGITHRDLKPSNVLMTDDGPVIIDFGIASIAEGATITRTGEITGTPGWMAPEQLNYEPVGEAVDVHGWGSLVQYAATGRGPFGEGTHEVLMYRVGKGVPMAHDIGGPLGERVTEALHRDPRKRPAIGDLATGDYATSGRQGSGRAALAVAMALAAVAVVGVGFWLADGSGLIEAGGPEGPAASTLGLRSSDPVSGPVVAAAFNSDGTKLVSGGVSEMAFVWELNEAGSTVATEPLALVGHNHELFSVAFSPDDSLVATASADGTARLWDAVTGQTVHVLDDHTNQVRSVAFSPDGLLLATGSGDSSIRLWDVATGESLRTLTAHETQVRAVAFSPDGSRLVSASFDQTLRLWNVETGEPVGEPWVGHTDRIRTVAYSPNGRVVASGGSDNVVRLWDVKSGTQIAELAGHERQINGVGFNQDGTIVASSSPDRQVRLWDVETGEQIGEPLAHNNWAWAVDFHPTLDNVLAVANSDGTVRLWNYQTGAQFADPLGGHSSIVSSVAYSPDGQQVISSVFLQSQLIDRQTGRETAKLEGHKDRVRAGSFSPDGSLLITAAHDSTLLLWDAETLEPIGLPLSGHVDQIRAIDVSSDGQSIVSAGQDGTVRVWNLSGGAASAEQRFELLGHSSPVLSVAVDPSGLIAASSDESGAVRLWDIENGEPLGGSLSGHDGAEYAVAFMDSERLASAGSDGVIRLWDVDGGSLLAELAGHGNHVRSLDADVESERLVSAGSDGQIVVWDVDSGDELERFSGHVGGVTAVAFSPDGTEVVSGGSDGTVRFWPLS